MIGFAAAWALQSILSQFIAELLPPSLDMVSLRVILFALFTATIALFASRCLSLCNYGRSLQWSYYVRSLMMPLPGLLGLQSCLDRDCPLALGLRRESVASGFVNGWHSWPVVHLTGCGLRDITVLGS